MSTTAESMSAFFIDTAARLDKRPYVESNAGTIMAKTALLFLALALAAHILYGGHNAPGKTLHSDLLVKVGETGGPVVGTTNA
jgi:hypothetical protein